MRIPRIPQYEAKGYIEGFEEKAQELFRNCFGGREFNMQSWKWQFWNNPCLTKRITTLWDNDILVALTALTPSYATVEGEQVICAVSGTTMARNDYRGVSIQLIQESQNQNSDIRFKYSFPNKQAFRIATQYYGHHYVGDIAFWTRVPKRVLVDEKIVKIESFASEHGNLYKELIKHHYFIKNRDEKYLNWRFVEKPNSRYEIYHYIDNTVRGYIVFNEYCENGEKHLQIIDIVSSNNDVFSKLVEFAINQGYERNDDIVKLWMTSKMYKDTLEKMSFTYGKQPFQMMVWDRDIQIEEAYITMSDSDVF